MNLIDAATKIALEAGALLKEGFGTRFHIDNKEGKHNLVTEYDTAAQHLIIDNLRQHFPSHHYLAEEDNVADPLTGEITWIIDPLDGTVNFAHNIPVFAVSIAAARGSEILAGVIYHPMQEELFRVEKGSGAFLNDRPISVTGQKELENAFLATGFPYNVNENPLNCIDRFAEMAHMGLPIRRLGCASIDLAYVAAGRYDGFWEVGLHPWDMAAGQLLIEEAGGVVTLYDGSTRPLYGYHPLLASNPSLHSQLVNVLKEDIQ